ncbi:uncharacterized protein (TIGR02453 family) [Pseudarthrobacter sulfonivorans]|nr:uncharacterized protein (TIGR02453 family) [Pseudarthrobacter sulfonivorans]
MSTFEGIPAGAFEFYAELEHNNNREWWLEHKDSYNTLVRDPVTALLAELEPRFGPGRIFRPNRDIRFSQDKSPYKTAQGAFASAQEGVGYYLQISADGLLVGGGYHSHTPAQLARFRNSVDASGTGESLRHIVDSVTAAGFAVEGRNSRPCRAGTTGTIHGPSCSSTSHFRAASNWAGRSGLRHRTPSGRSPECGTSSGPWWSG